MFFKKILLGGPSVHGIWTNFRFNYHYFLILSYFCVLHFTIEFLKVSIVFSNWSTAARQCILNSSELFFSRPFIVQGFRRLIERVIRIKYCLPYFSFILAEEFRSLLSSLKWSRALRLMYKKVWSTHPETTSAVNS